MSEEKRRIIEEARAARIAALGEWLNARLAPPAAPFRVLEIGCGHGHFLSAYAAAHPEHFCLGVDLLSKRIRRAIRKRDNAHLANLEFLKADAGELLEAWTPAFPLSAIFILHPDPWPKTRHHKNRLIQPAFLDILAGLSTTGATRLHFRTDHDAYFDWAREHVAAHPAWEILDGAPWPFEQETVFSQRLPHHQDLIAVRH
ncbi:MAG: tRNA (guanosine(46)-N7)-methyltransferase TrmB [Puniceicoccales bacterium]|jgi:tRNA (guanine-N7-)-methyltransferase|nr:tRNA (guanosine(46)-N7)-methyltransferase TrmB [Puniceicoccales bacterium]